MVNTLKTSLLQSRVDNNVSRIADTGEKMYSVVFKSKILRGLRRKIKILFNTNPLTLLRLWIDILFNTQTFGSVYLSNLNNRLSIKTGYRYPALPDRIKSNKTCVYRIAGLAHHIKNFTILSMPTPLPMPAVVQ